MSLIRNVVHDRRLGDTDRHLDRGDATLRRHIAVDAASLIVIMESAHLILSADGWRIAEATAVLSHASSGRSGR
jgi:hypothetical protein